MKVLFCTTAFHRAVTGASRFARQFAGKDALGIDIEVDVLTTDYAGETKGVFPVEVSNPSRLPFLNYRLEAMTFAGHLADVLNDGDYDCVVFNNAWLAAFFRPAVYDVPVIGFIHDELALIPRRSLLNHPGIMFSAIARRNCERKGLLKLNSLVVNSNYLAERIVRGYGFDRSKMEIFRPLSIDPGKVPFHFNQIDGDLPVKVLYVKTSIFWGRLPLLIEALGLLSKYRFELTVIGPSPEYANSVFGRSGSPINVQLRAAGEISDHGDVIAEMGAHHIFCTPVRFEAMGIANIEAALAGLRLVVSDIGGICEVIDSALCAITDPADPGTISRAVEDYILEDQDMARQRASNLRAHVVDKLKSEGDLIKLGDLIRRVVARRN